MNNFDLIVVRPKINKTKVVIAILISILLVVVFSMLGIHAAKRYVIKQAQKLNQNQGLTTEVLGVKQEEIQEIPQQEEQNQQNQQEQEKKLPVYTPEAQEAIHNIYHGQEKIVYLTFDDGPSKTVTPLILDLLKQENIKATFFVLGSRVELNPDLVKREYEEGHYIANHGYSHTYSSIYSSIDAILNEYYSTQDAIRNAIGLPEYSSHLFRYPGGSVGGKYREIKAEAKPVLEQNEIAYLDWNALTSDAAGAKTKEAMMASLTENIDNKNTVVVLMHDAGDKILTYEVLPEVIQFFRDRGYTFGDMYNIMRQTEQSE